MALTEQERQLQLEVSFLSGPQIGGAARPTEELEMQGLVAGAAHLRGGSSVKRRLWVMVLLLSTWGGLVGARLWQLQVVDGDAVTVERALNQQLRKVDLEPPRGAIYDARGEELAVSMEVDSAFAVPSEVEDPQAVHSEARSPAHLEGIDVADLAARSGGRPGLCLGGAPVGSARGGGVDGQRNGSRCPLPTRAQALLPLARTWRPRYSASSGMDHIGLGGLEARYQNELTGEAAHRSVFLDALRRTAMVSDLDFGEPAPGQDLHLTLDASIQYLAERELKPGGREGRHALGGVAVVLDVEDRRGVGGRQLPGVRSERLHRLSGVQPAQPMSSPMSMNRDRPSRWCRRLPPWRPTSTTRAMRSTARWGPWSSMASASVITRSSTS